MKIFGGDKINENKKKIKKNLLKVEFGPLGQKKL